MRKSFSAFTLVELMVVIMIISVVAGFAIPNYTKSVEKAREKDAENNLKVIHAAQQMYAAKNNGAYWGPGNLSQINSALEILIIANGMVYSCAAPGAATFTCSALRNGGGAWTLRVTESSTEPCCVVGNACPSIPDC